MKRLYLIFIMTAVAFCGMAQTIGDAFYIYRNDGEFNAFFRDEVLSIEYSYMDAEGNTHDEVVTQVVNTADSVYMIPLAAIDSVGFVQPETKYKADAIPLTGTLFDYLLKAEGMTLTFDGSLPTAMKPKVADRLVTMELTEKLPYGFAGVVTKVSDGTDGIDVVCDSIDFEDVVERFYGVVAYGGDDTFQSSQSRAPATSQGSRAPVVLTRNYDLPNTPIDIPIDISAYITKKSIYDINGKAELNVNIKPQTRVKITLVIDGLRSHTQLHLTSRLVTSTKIDICGEANKELKLNLLPNDGNCKGPWGIPLYFAIGPKLEFGGELLAGFTARATIDVEADYKYYPAMVIFSPLLLAPVVNEVTGNVNISGFDLTFDQVGAKGTLRGGAFFRLGVTPGDHKKAWMGLEADGGAKCDVNFLFDIARLREADKSTALYDELKSLCDLEAKPFFGIHFMASAQDDHYTFKTGPKFDNFGGTWFKGGLLPSFDGTKLSHSPRGSKSADATTNISGACPIPYTVGFSLFDGDGNRVQQPVWHGEKYSLFNRFPSYKGAFDNLRTDGFYTVYPAIRLFNYDMLASPSANLSMEIPVTLSDFKVTKSQYKKDGFTHEGKTYDYRFDVSVKATLYEASPDITEWGYAYLDPNGREALIPLTKFGNTYTDTRYAYFRNEASSTCTLYGYVKYAGSDEPVYGTPMDFPLEYKTTACPDNNHPHMIDLGLPSGTKWACCNVGAAAPEQYGSYFAWGETQPKSVYNWETYLYGGYWDDVDYIDYIGSDIAGTGYDAASANWGTQWRMPSLEQCDEFVNNTTWEWTAQNGVNGMKFTGPNGGTIFLPAAGYRWGGGLYYAGDYGDYWSSTLYGGGPDGAWGLYFVGGDASTYYYYDRDIGHSVRPVRSN